MFAGGRSRHRVHLSEGFRKRLLWLFVAYVIADLPQVRRRRLHPKECHVMHDLIEPYPRVVSDKQEMCVTCADEVSLVQIGDALRYVIAQLEFVTFIGLV